MLEPPRLRRGWPVVAGQGGSVSATDADSATSKYASCSPPHGLALAHTCIKAPCTAHGARTASCMRIRVACAFHQLQSTPGDSDAALGMVGVSDGPPIVPCAIRLVDDGRAVLELGAHLCRRATPGHEHGGRATAARSARGESAGAAAHGGPTRTGRAGQARDQHRHARGEDGLAAGCRQHWPRPHCLHLSHSSTLQRSAGVVTNAFGVVKWFVT